jgi:hypothetical protein
VNAAARDFYKILSHFALEASLSSFLFNEQTTFIHSIQNFRFHHTLEPHFKAQPWLIQMEVVVEVVITPINAVTGMSKIVVDGYIRTGMLVQNARYLVKSFSPPFTNS